MERSGLSVPGTSASCYTLPGNRRQDTPHRDTLRNRNYTQPSRCSISTSQIRTLPDLQGTSRTEMHPSHFYIPDRLSIVAQHEVKLIEEAVEQLNEIKTKLTETQLMYDLDSLIHTHRTSLHQRQRTQWYFTLALIFSAVSILIILSFMFRFYIMKLILQCCPAKKTKQQAIELTPLPHPPQPAQRIHETRTDDLQGNVTFTSYTLQDS